MEVIVAFFNDYYDLRTKYGFKPQNIYNFDETMINPCTNKKKVILFIEQPDPVVYETGKLEHITILFCVGATRRFMKPLLILPRKTVP